MAIAQFNEQAQRYMQPGSTRFMGTKAAEAHNAAQSGGGSPAAGSSLGGIAGPIVAALRTEFKGLNAHLAFRFGTVIAAMGGTAAERRDELISSGDTDSVIPEETPKEKLGMLDTLKGMNPFKDGIGTKAMILLLVGGLWAITTLGDKLVKPLSGFLKWLKEDAMDDVAALWDNVKGWWTTSWDKVKGWFNWIEDVFVPKIQTLWDDLKKWYEEDWPLMVEKFTNLKETVKEWWDEQWPKVEKFWDWMKGIFTSIGDYIDSFDTDGVEGLSAEERKKLIGDLTDKVKVFVGDALTSIWDNTNKWVLAAFAVGGFATLALKGVVIGSIARWVAGGGSAAASGAPVGMISRMAASGTLTKLGLAGIVAGSLIGVFSAGRDAMTDSIDEETGKLNFTKFAAGFISGTEDKEGGWKQAITNAFTGGPTAAGALIGVGLGAIGGPFGMLAGGLMGAAIGGLIGGIAGYIGADNMDAAISGVTGLLSTAIDDITTFFGGIFAGVDSWARGEGYKKGQNDFLAKVGEGKVGGREGEIKTLEEQLALAEFSLQSRRARDEEGLFIGTRTERSAITAIERLKANIRNKQKKLESDKDFIHDTQVTSAVESYQEADMELSHLRHEMEKNQYDPNAEPGFRQSANDYMKWKRKVTKWEKQKMDAILVLDKYGLDYTQDKLFNEAALNKIINPPSASEIKRANFVKQMEDEGKIRVLNPDADRLAKGDNKYHWVDAATYHKTQVDQTLNNGLVTDNPELSSALSASWTIFYAYPDNHR